MLTREEAREAFRPECSQCELIEDIPMEERLGYVRNDGWCDYPECEDCELRPPLEDDSELPCPSTGCYWAMEPETGAWIEKSDPEYWLPDSREDY